MIGYIYSSCYYHNQIGGIHLSHCYHIFSWLCASYVCYIIFCHLLHIRSGKTGNLFSLLLCILWWVQILGYALACKSYSFVCTVHHLIIIVQIYLKALNLLNACQTYFVECVSEIKHILAAIHFTRCVAVCFQFTHFFCDDRDYIYTLFYHHHQIVVWTTTHCLGLGHETMVSAVCLSIFLCLDCGKRVIRKISNAGSQASYGPYHRLDLPNHEIG